VDAAWMGNLHYNRERNGLSASGIGIGDYQPASGSSSLWTAAASSL